MSAVKGNREVDSEIKRNREIMTKELSIILTAYASVAVLRASCATVVALSMTALEFTKHILLDSACAMADVSKDNVWSPCPPVALYCFSI